MTQPIPKQHRGRAGILAPELAVRRVLVDGLLELVASDFKLEQLFDRLDEYKDDADSDGALWSSTLRTALRELVTGEDGPQMRVALGDPPGDGAMPYISISIGGGRENESEAAMGEILSAKYRLTGDPALDADGDLRSGQTRRYVRRGIGYTSTVEVGVWAATVPMAYMLHAAVRLVLMLRRPWLTQYGAHRVAMSDSAMRPDPRLHPRIQTVPTITLTVDWTLAITEREAPEPTQVNMTAGNFGGA